MTSIARALVLGLGSSGASATQLLRSEGTDVVAIDQADLPALRERAARLRDAGAEIRLGSTSVPQGPFDVAVISPGLSPDSPLFRAAVDRGIPLLPEFELGWSRHKGRTIGVTGTNGKSTMVKWIKEAIEADGQSAVACGNYGLPVSQAVLDTPKVDWLVIELSSFQLEHHHAFRADTGLLLNILPNHLDRHGTMGAYTRAKTRIFEQMTKDDAAVVHEPAAALLGEGRWTTFGDSSTSAYVYREGKILAAGDTVCDLRGTFFDNEILGVNATGACAALLASGISRRAIESSARAFQALPHRMQPVATIRGVKFINDSKSTTLSATAAALRMCKGKARLIAGGLLKENDLSPVKNVLAERASAVYLVGQASKLMASAWSDTVPCVETGTLKAAVQCAFKDAVEGETILLSPGCASFDQFRNYEDRGRQFVDEVGKLGAETI